MKRYHETLKPYFTVHPYAKAPEKYCEGYVLADVYGTYSYRKEQAFKYCKALCERFNGWGFCITSHSTFTFCAMFDFENPETGEIMRAHITPTYNHAYYL